MEPYLTDIQATRLFLKRHFDGPEVVKALRFRLQTHLADPTLDPLSSQVWEAYLKLPQLLREPFSLLDAGCMSGFLYHHLKKYFSDFTYTGMDRWPEAIQVGREFAPEATFIKRDFLNDDLGDLSKSFDYVVCSNIPFRNGDADEAARKLVEVATRAVIFIYPGSGMQIFE